MNLFAQAVIGMLIIKAFVPQWWDYAWIYVMGAFLANVIDYDHIKPLVKALRDLGVSKIRYGPQLIRYGPHLIKFGPDIRCRWHELYGLGISTPIFWTISFFTPLALPLYLAFASHYAADYLTREIRPFYPFSRKTIHLGIWPRRIKTLILVEGIFTVALIFFAVYLAATCVDCIAFDVTARAIGG